MNLRQIDFDHLWHPFTQAKVWFEDEPLIIERAEGMELIDVEGRRYLDGVSSLWCNVHGHGAPQLVEALREQAGDLCHSTLLGLSHRPALELTERLMKIAPSGLTRVFYSDGGSAAVEAALRMCLEWWGRRPQPSARKKRHLISLDTAYHGDTLGAVGVGYLPAFHGALERNIVPALRVPPPHLFRFFEGDEQETACDRSLSALRSLLEKSGNDVAAMIIEPLVQGAAGIWTHPARFLREARELCRKYDVLFIADEVATGIGKTGTMFAVEQAEITPDVLITAKGLSGGYLPISAALATEELFQGFLGEPSELKTFFYGQTFAGNPLAARVSCANLDLIESSNLLALLPSRIERFHEMIERQIDSLPCVFEVRKKGVMIGIELTSEPGSYKPFPPDALAGARVVRAARKRGVIIRPIGNVVILMPPLAMSEADLSRLVSVTAEALSEALT